VNSGLEPHHIDLPTKGLRIGVKVTCTFLRPDAGKWEETTWESLVVPKREYLLRKAFIFGLRVIA